MFTLELPNTEAEMLINAWLKNQVLLWPFEITKGQYTIIKCLHPENAFTTTEVSAIRRAIANIMSNTAAPYIYTDTRKHYRYFVDGRISTGDTKTIIPFIWSEQLEQYAYYLMMQATS